MLALVNYIISGTVELLHCLTTAGTVAVSYSKVAMAITGSAAAAAAVQLISEAIKCDWLLL